MPNRVPLEFVDLKTIPYWACRYCGIDNVYGFGKTYEEAQTALELQETLIIECGEIRFTRIGNTNDQSMRTIARSGEQYSIGLTTSDALHTMISYPGVKTLVPSWEHSRDTWIYSVGDRVFREHTARECYHNALLYRELKDLDIDEKKYELEYYRSTREWRCVDHETHAVGIGATPLIAYRQVKRIGERQLFLALSQAVLPPEMRAHWARFQDSYWKECDDRDAV